MSDAKAMEAGLDLLAGPRPSAKERFGERLHEGMFPSGSNMYGGAHAAGRFLIRELGGEDEEILFDKRNATKVIDTVVRACWIEPEIPYDELLLGDQAYMMFFLRTASIGLTYRFDVECTKETCKNKFRTAVDFPAGMKVTMLTPEDKEPFSWVLPESKQEVQFRLLRVKDETSINEKVKRAMNLPGRTGNPQSLIRLAHNILSLGGEAVDFGQAHSRLKKMGWKDIQALRRRIDAYTPGVELSLRRECPLCGVEFESSIPFTREFFLGGDDEVPAPG